MIRADFFEPCRGGFIALRDASKEQRLLASEVMIEACFLDATGIGQRAHRRRGVALGKKELGCARDDFPAPALLTVIVRSGHCFCLEHH